jgi:putative DNA-binding protein
MNGPDTAALLAQQRALQEAIMSASAAAAGSDPGILHERTRARLKVYRHAYRTRLITALDDNFGVLRQLMGDDAFEALGHAFAQAHPSTYRSIRWFGNRLPEFMAAREDLAPHPALADMARMEQALRDAFDAADAPVLTLADLAALPPESWPGLRFVPHPGVRMLRLQWAVEPAWRALQEATAAAGAGDTPAAGSDGEGGPCTLPPPEAHAHVLLVWRQGLETRWRSLAAPEDGWLGAILDGESFGHLCERAADLHAGDDQQATLAAARALQQWLHEGLFSRLAP